MNHLSIIAAIGKNRELGFKNDLIWKIREDLTYFKNKTMNSYIIMGRKTFDSLPKKLVGRTYMILSNQLQNENHLIFRNVEEIITFINNNQGNYYVIGGGEMYSLFMPYVDTMYLTEINDSY